MSGHIPCKGVRSCESLGDGPGDAFRIIDHIAEISQDVTGIARYRDDTNPSMTMARFP